MYVKNVSCFVHLREIWLRNNVPSFVDLWEPWNNVCTLGNWLLKRLLRAILEVFSLGWCSSTWRRQEARNDRVCNIWCRPYCKTTYTRPITWSSLRPDSRTFCASVVHVRSLLWSRERWWETADIADVSHKCYRNCHQGKEHSILLFDYFGK